MSSSPDSSSPDSPYLHERLLQVKKSIQKATAQALQSLETTIDVRESDNPNASFHLGMQLFGQDTATLERSLQGKLEEVERELNSIVKEAETAQDLAQTLPEVQQETRQLKQKLAFLKACSQARQKLDESVTLSTPALAPQGETDLITAATVWRQAQDACEQATLLLQEEENHSPNSRMLITAYQMVDSIRDDLRRHKVHLLGRLQTLWHASVQITPRSIIVSHKEQPVKLCHDVLHVLAPEDHHKLIKNTVDRLYQEVLEPVLASHSSDNATNRTTTEQVQVTRRGHKLEWTHPHDQVFVSDDEKNDQLDQTPIQLWKPTLDFVQSVLVFFAEEALLSRTDLCQLVGQYLLGEPKAMPPSLDLTALGIESHRIRNDDGILLVALVDGIRDSCLPDVCPPHELSLIENMAAEVQSSVLPFIDALLSSQLLANKSNRLADLALRWEEIYVENRRALLLDQARTLLMKNDYHNTVQVGEEVRKRKDDLLDDGMSVFYLHKSSISDTAMKTMALCRSIMDEAVHQPSMPTGSPLSFLPATLYRTARETLDLYRAIIPARVGKEIKTVPRLAAIFHNDCVFLAYNCLTLGLEYKDQFPATQPDDVRGNLLRQNCMFIDMVPLFREMAERSLRDMLGLQASQLAQLIHPRISYLAQSLRSEDVCAEWSDAEAGVEAVLYHLRHLSEIWKPVLSDDIFNTTMGYLVDVTYTLFLDEITAATDISGNACQFAVSLFGTLMTGVHDVTPDTAACRVQSRFDAIGKLFSMSLADIQRALSDGVFSCLTGTELSRMIRALFDDSPNRRQLLQLLSSG